VGFAAFRVFPCRAPVDDEVSEFGSEDLSKPAVFSDQWLDKKGVENRFSFLFVPGFDEMEPAAVIALMEMCDGEEYPFP
jgi:hypothetical protein